MNCQAVQNQILALPDPRELTPELREHVLSCEACKAWAKQAARLEAILAQLPVPAPPAEKKEKMLGELMAADPVILPMPTPAARPSRGAAALRFLRDNAKAVSGLAAAVLIAVGVYAMWPRGETPPGQPELTQADPLPRKLAKRNVEMARAETPANRLEVLGGIAEDISADTRGLSNIAPTELKDRANQYEKVVREGMMARLKEVQGQAVGMSAADKTKLFDSMAEKLAKDATESEKKAGEAPPDAQPVFKRMADAARDGEKTLRAAAREGK